MLGIVKACELLMQGKKITSNAAPDGEYLTTNAAGQIVDEKGRFYYPDVQTFAIHTQHQFKKMGVPMDARVFSVFEDTQDLGGILKELGISFSAIDENNISEN